MQQAESAGIFAGCLPLLVQLPFFSIMYRLFRSGEVYGKPNTLLTHHLLSAPLSSHWLSGAGPVSLQGAVFAGLLALLGVAAWFCVRLARQPAGPGQAGSNREVGWKGARLATAQAGARRGAKPAEQPAGALGALPRLLPYSTLIVAAVVPLAAGLHLLTTTTWTVLERTALRRRLIAGAHG